MHMPESRYISSDSPMDSLCQAQTMKPITAPYTVLTDRLRGRGNKSKWIEYLITATCAIGSVESLYMPRELSTDSAP